MNPSSFYQAVSGVVNQLSLECRVRRVLRDYVLGTLVSGSCLVGDVALALRPRGTVDSQYRRLQRFLGNQQVKVADLQGEWAQIVSGTCNRSA